MSINLVAAAFSISLKARILREWQKTTRAEDQEFSERDLLTLELINDFSPITEKGLCKVLGIAFSSASDVVKRLIELGLVDSSDKSRGTPLALTAAGKEKLTRIKATSATRFAYLFENLNKRDIAMLEKVLKKIDNSAGETIQRLVFDRYAGD